MKCLAIFRRLIKRYFGTTCKLLSGTSDRGVIEEKYQSSWWCLQEALNQNRDRAIILVKSGEHWFYTFLYAKQDMANIDNRELAGFRELAKHYAALSDEKITALIKSKGLVEICHDCKK